MREEFSKMFLSIFFLIFILFIRHVFIIKLMPFWTLSEKVTLWHVFDHIVTISKSCDLYSFGVCSVVLPCRVRPMAILIILYSICFRIPTLCFFVRCSKFKSSFFFFICIDFVWLYIAMYYSNVEKKVPPTFTYCCLMSMGLESSKLQVHLNMPSASQQSSLFCGRPFHGTEMNGIRSSSNGNLLGIMGCPVD